MARPIALTGLCAVWSRKLGYDAPVVATGGLAPLIAGHSRTITAVQPDLTLVGLRLVYAECTKAGN